MDIFIRAGEYKSIKAPLEWTGIPKFAVITGENGTGKTQFLECVHGSLSPPARASQNPFASLRIEVSGIDIRPSDVVFLPDMSGRMPSGEFGLPEVASAIREMVNRAARNEAPRDAYELPVLTELRELGAAQVDVDELIAKFRPEFFLLQPADDASEH